MEKVTYKISNILKTLKKKREKTKENRLTKENN